MLAEKQHHARRWPAPQPESRRGKFLGRFMPKLPILPCIQSASNATRLNPSTQHALDANGPAPQSEKPHHAFQPATDRSHSRTAKDIELV